jgi:glutamine amidotransferase
MCRLLAVRDAAPFAIGDLLEALARIAKASKEYQGDGWGCAWWTGERWERYRSIRPIWEDDLGRFGATTVLLGHARSAFRNEGIEVENNMPFLDDRSAFIFNGELRGVSIVAPGRIGAEKLFRFIRRLGADSSLERFRHALEVVRRRTKYVRAMNLVLATGPTLRVASWYSEDPDYFTLHLSRGDSRTMISSEPFPGPRRWEPQLSGTALELG